MRSAFGIVIILFLFFIRVPFVSAEPSISSSSASVPVIIPTKGINLTLTPVFANLATDPGVPVSSQMRITNNNDFTEALVIKLAKYTFSHDGLSPVIAPMTDEDEFGKWVSFSEQQFVVGPNQSKVIKYTITPPKDAALGYYYAFIIDRATQEGSNQKGPAVVGAPAISVLLEVKSPQSRKELQLLDFKTSHLVYEYLPVEFQVHVKNTGNVHIVPAGDIFIDSMVNKDVAIIKANPGHGNILPQSKRIYTSYWDDGFPLKVIKEEHDIPVRDSKGVVQITDKYDLSTINKFRIGRYTAHVLLVYDNGQRDVPLEATTSFWIIPWKIIAALLIVILLAIMGVLSTLRSIFRRLIPKGRS